MGGHDYHIPQPREAPPTGKTLSLLYVEWHSLHCCLQYIEPGDFHLKVITLQSLKNVQVFH